MPQAKECPKCSGSMAEGFVVDTTYGGAGVSTWMEGAPQRSLWTGLKVTGRPRSEIVTWRCGRCGFLEQFAPASPDRSHEAAQKKQGLLVMAIAFAVLLVALGGVLVLR
jgi:hypothetical protein